MASTSWQKKWVVLYKSGYSNKWSCRTIPCTFNQAARFISLKHLDAAMTNGEVRIASLQEWNELEESQLNQTC